MEPPRCTGFAQPLVPKLTSDKSLMNWERQGQLQIRAAANRHLLASDVQNNWGSTIRPCRGLAQWRIIAYRKKLDAASTRASDTPCGSRIRSHSISTALTYERLLHSG